MSRLGYNPQAKSPIGTPEGNQVSQFEQLALPLLDSVYNFAYWLSQDRENAEDLVQEAYLKAWRGFSSFRPGSNFRAWMFQISKNTFLNSYSQAKRARTVPFDSEEVSPLLPFVCTG